MFSISAGMVPLSYMSAFYYKHRNFELDYSKKQPTFNEILEKYPITRRAWKRALLIRDQEMIEIKSKVKEL